MGGEPVLCLSQMNAVLDRITYKPGWTFTIEEPDIVQGHFLHINVFTKDATGAIPIAELRIFSPIPNTHSENEFLNWVMHRVKAAELHEVCEWFAVDGKPYIDPHAPL